MCEDWRKKKNCAYHELSHTFKHVYKAMLTNEKIYDWKTERLLGGRGGYVNWNRYGGGMLIKLIHLYFDIRGGDYTYACIYIVKAKDIDDKKEGRGDGEKNGEI